MKTICFLKDCDNFNGDFDCILHYSKIQHEAQQKIIMHYNAMRSRMEEIMSENANYEEQARKKCRNQLEQIYSVIKTRTDGAISPDTSTSSSTPSQRSTRSSNNSQSTVKKGPLSGKENSPMKKLKNRSSRSGKELSKDFSVDPKPAKEKRTKQTKLPFFTTSSAKKRRPQDDPNDEDEDMTFCAELERGINNLNTNMKPASDKAKTPTNDAQDIFNFGTLENFHTKKSLEKTSPNAEHLTEQTRKKLFRIKTEKEDDRSFQHLPPALSPDIFLSDLSNSNNSVVFIEPSEKEVITISDRTYNPPRDLMREIQKGIHETRRKKLFEDSEPVDARPIQKIEERDVYEGECLDCQIFYDNIAEKKSLSEANAEINECPIKCDGWKERCKKLGRKDKSRKNGMVILKCNSKFARRRKEDKSNDTAPGIWDLNVEPRKSKPLFNKNNENYETPDL